MTIKTVDVQESQTNLTELLALVREGTEIILTEGGTPLARLSPVGADQRIPDPSVEQTGQTRILGLHAHLGTAWTSEDFDDPLPDEFWMGDE